MLFKRVMKPIIICSFECNKSLSKLHNIEHMQVDINIAKGVFSCGNKKIEIKLFVTNGESDTFIYRIGKDIFACDLWVPESSTDDILRDFRLLAWKYFAEKYYRTPYEEYDREGYPHIVDPCCTLRHKPA